VRVAIGALVLNDSFLSVSREETIDWIEDHYGDYG
jgi:hypothetical protein